MKYKLAFVVCLWPWSVFTHYICNLYGTGPCSCSEEMTKWPRRTAALRTRPRRSGTRPAKPDVQMTRSSSVGGAVFRGTCGYPPSKEDKNCSHLHLHVYRLYSGSCTSMLLHSKLYCGSENNSNLRQLCFDLPRQDMLKPLI